MKIEIGKIYRTAGGHEVTIMEHVPHSAFPWRGVFGTDGNGGTMSWGADGRQCNGAADFDLVYQIDPKPLCLQVGKMYRTRSGDVVCIETHYQDTVDEFSRYQGFHNGSREGWRADGRYYRFGQSELDLVEDVTQDASAIGFGADGKNYPFSLFSSGDTCKSDGSNGPICISIPILDGVSPEVAAIAALENLMLDATSNRNLSTNERIRVANWFAERYGDDFVGSRT